jgi:hypothetical protein
MKKKKSSKIDKIAGTLMGLELNLKLLEDDIENVQSNIAYLKNIKKDLEYNINLHRSDKVITVVEGYRKSLEELKSIKKEIEKFENSEKKLKLKMEQKLKTYDYYFEEYVKEIESLKKEAKILLFKRDKDG